MENIALNILSLYGVNKIHYPGITVKTFSAKKWYKGKGGDKHNKNWHMFQNYMMSTKSIIPA